MFLNDSRQQQMMQRLALFIAALLWALPALAQGVSPGPSAYGVSPTNYQTIAQTSCTFSPPVQANGWNWILNISSSCSTSTLPVPTGLTTGQSGTIRINQSSNGGGVITLSGSAYALNVTTIPVDADPLSATDWSYYIDNSGNIIITGSAYPPTINNALYLNLLTGGNSMTSGWTCQGCLGGALATNAGTDPLSGSTAAKLTEDTTNAVHRVIQTVSGGSSSGTQTYSCFGKNSVGTRYMECSAADNTFSNRINVIINLAAGCSNANTFIGTIGSGTIAKYGAIVRPNGWCQIWMQGNVNGSGVPFFTVQNSTVSGDSYAGDGTSANFYWLPKQSVGANGPPP